MTFIFRVFANERSGLGHLTRCALLAKKCCELGFESKLVCDVLDQKHLSFASGISIEGLYPNMPTFIDQMKDADLFIDICRLFQQHLKWVIVDHYMLDAAWESAVKKNLNVKVLSIDDLMREHECDALVDYRWRGASTNNAYKHKIPIYAAAFLGVRYAIMPQITEFSKSIRSSKKNDVFVILISMGGGGDGVFIKQLLVALAENIQVQSMTINFQVVIGPFMQNKTALLEELSNLTRESSTDLIVTPLVGLNDLTEVITNCDLYLGAAGSVIYPLRAVNKPAITFAVADNQENDLQQLADIGQYWHLNNLSLDDLPTLSAFVQEVITQYARVQQLFSKAHVSIDDCGTERVARYLCFDEKESLQSTISELPLHAVKSDLHLEPVDDQDLVHYLLSRNRDANRKNMLDNRPIPALHHFSWWLKTQRQSFKLVNPTNQTLLYIWHELKVVDSQSFLIGGWFVADEGVGVQEAMFALDWQLRTCEKDYPDATWIAVINQRNKTVKRLNDYFGFKEITTSSRYYSIIKRLFPLADQTEFFYVCK
ncbi:hypothetical protein JX580_02080 [Thiomicrospira microaerophila]|uniref:hypothetical protein n=1 Tax=Thiomicrospira microaerophila TaxID=406020 RepID=UPI00200D698E|nr:hypothetical protein [Thiomicrospira microaerophila]UQB42707.1 hypothetical protein JX580_02080 [Thiomicrospira microaerophila]